MGKATEDISRAMWGAVNTLYKEEERRKKDSARQARAERSRSKPTQVSLKDAVFRVLPEALDKATGDGTYEVSARTLYYQVRTLIQRYTHKELDHGYFSQDLISSYREEYGPIQGLYLRSARAPL